MIGPEDSFWTAELKTTGRTNVEQLVRSKGRGGDKGVPYSQPKQAVVTSLVIEVGQVYRFQISSKASRYHPPRFAAWLSVPPASPLSTSSVAFMILQGKTICKRSSTNVFVPGLEKSHVVPIFAL